MKRLLALAVVLACCSSPDGKEELQARIVAFASTLGLSNVRCNFEIGDGCGGVSVATCIADTAGHTSVAFECKGNCRLTANTERVSTDPEAP